MSEVSPDSGALRGVYRELCGERDPALRWLMVGAADCRFAGAVTPRAIVRGSGDLVELYYLVDDLFGTDTLWRPPHADGEVRRSRLTVARPAEVMPLLEALRPQLEHRGPAFWTWKSAREALARGLIDLGGLTVEAVRVVV